jgi:predicted Zn-ribbon and HTH transcriptional regulator
MWLPWECEDCGHQLKDSPMLTYIDCPKCGSENFFHGQIIEDDWEQYNIYEDED